MLLDMKGESIQLEYQKKDMMITCMELLILKDKLILIGKKEM